jgi:hypothetical protein
VPSWDADDPSRPEGGDPTPDRPRGLDLRGRAGVASIPVLFSLRLVAATNESSLVRPSDRCRGLAGEDQCQGGAPAAERGRTTLTVIFARRQDARREEDGPVRYAGGGHRGSVTACATGLRARAS